MHKLIAIILVSVMSIYLNGCGKKQQTLEELQEPMSMEALSTLESETKVASEVNAPEPLPPAGPYKPTNQEIQTALKNAGYYAGLVDGKIGPMTKKAIEDFQKANALQADGKVGPKTWEALSVYLNPPVESKPKKK